tara:strand:- start:187 stop:1377 length:1191 start_codon:yes stop_codon:yes gene_type:complete
MKSKKNIKPRKMVIDNTMNDEIVDILKKYLNKMDVSYQDMVLSKKIYERICSSYKDSCKLHHDYSVKDMSSPCELTPSSFLPQEMIQTIHTTLHYQYRVVFSHKNIDFTVSIYTNRMVPIADYISYIKWIVCLCLQNIKNEKKEVMIIDLYLTSLKKMVPGGFNQVIQPIHINSGYSMFSEMHICIYREEEWMKVLLHECFHAFNMDFHEEQIQFPNLFQNTFFIHSKFLVFESFVEFWARVLNCALFTYTLKPSMNCKEFCEVFALNLNIERIHSLLQASKMLNLFQLTYKDTISSEKGAICKTIYKEDTNAFCYYVITAILMNFFDKTIQWFDVHNNDDLFQFDKSERQVVIFCHYIKQLAKSESLIEILDELNVCKIQKENYMKMTLFEIKLK